MILYIIAFLLGICSLHFFPELPSFKISLLIIVFLLLSSYCLNKLLIWVQKKTEKHPINFKHHKNVNHNKIRRFITNIIAYSGGSKRESLIIRYFFGFMLALILGYLWMWMHVYLNLAKRLPTHLEGEALQVVGTIANLPEKQNGRMRFEFEVDYTIPKTLWENSGRIILSYYDSHYNLYNNEHSKHSNNQPENKKVLKRESFQLKNVKFNPLDLKVGDRWQFWVKLKKPRGYSNPGGFDKEKHYFQNRWQAQGRILLKLPKKRKNKMIEAGNRDVDCIPKRLSSSWYSFPIHRLRATLLEKIKNSIEQKTFAPFIYALILGVRDGILDEHWNVFRNTGTAHLMAISGLHVGLVSSFIYFIIKWFWRFLPKKCLNVPANWMAALLATLGAWIYALLAGFSIPTQRALVMILLFMGSILFRRVGNVWRTYFIALLMVLLWDPFATLSIGFWLSFAAVAMMLYGLKGRLNPGGLWWKYGRAQWVTFLGLIPVTLMCFNQTSLISPIANILAIPWVSFSVVPFALLGSILLFFSEKMGGVLLNFAEASFSILWPFLNYLSQLSKISFIPETEISILAFILAIFASLILLAPRGFAGRFLGIIAFLPLLLAKPISPLLGTAKFTLLDVGQGLAAVLQTNQHVLLFDTGPRFGLASDAGSQVILPFLENQGIKKIDAIVISHGDSDHIGGLSSILKKIPVGMILSSEIDLIPKFTSNDTIIKPCYSGQHWHWDGIEFLMIHPDTFQTAKRNDHCCVLQIKAGKQKILLTGDIEMPSEKKLLEKFNHKLSSTVLIVPHHGSKTSSSLEFIQTVNPSFAMIPVGYLNPYGHPKTEIVDRYKNLNISLFDNIQDGSISFTLNDHENISFPTSYRGKYKHFWQWEFK